VIAPLGEKRRACTPEQNRKMRRRNQTRGISFDPGTGKRTTHQASHIQRIGDVQKGEYTRGVGESLHRPTLTRLGGKGGPPKFSMSGAGEKSWRVFPAKKMLVLQREGKRMGTGGFVRSLDLQKGNCA